MLRKLSRSHRACPVECHVSNRSNIKILCKRCGKIFEQRTSHHLSGCGCPKCSDDKKRMGFVKKAKRMYGDEFEYLSEYKNNKTPIKIKHNSCGNIFSQNPSNHLQGSGCPRCNGGIKYTERYFLCMARKKHGNQFEYGRFYGYTKNNIEIFCKKCKNKYFQKPYMHLRGDGCLVCGKTKGETEVERVLKEAGLTYEFQKRFNDCINPKTNRKLIFDFYVPNKNLLIEFDGKFHYERHPKANVGDFCDALYRDMIKNDYAKSNNIELLRISYKQIKDIEKILSKLFY